jgi:cytochrome-b5 reductase
MSKFKSAEPTKYKITKIDQITHDTKAFRFELPENSSLDFLPGDHMMIQAEINGQTHRRPYTPSSTPDDIGYFEMIIKKYPTGLVSGYIHGKNVGDMVILEGPTSGGHFQQGMADKIAMIAGGAGITPMISIIRTAIRRGYGTDMLLIFANKSEQDIILRDELEKYASENDKFGCKLVLDQAPDNWTGHTGYIDEAFLKAHLPSPDDNPLIFLCGPPMMEYKLKQAILAIGYEKSRIVVP